MALGFLGVSKRGSLPRKRAWYFSLNLVHNKQMAWSIRDTLLAGLAFARISSNPYSRYISGPS